LHFPGSSHSQKNSEGNRVVDNTESQASQQHGSGESKRRS
jgi:hypothetical protein